MGNQGTNSATRVTGFGNKGAGEESSLPRLFRNDAEAPAPKFTYAEVRAKRAAAFAEIEAPQLPLGNLALTTAEIRDHAASAEQHLAASRVMLGELDDYRQNQAALAHGTGRAIALIAMAVGVLIIALALGGLAHLGAEAILTPAQN